MKAAIDEARYGDLLAEFRPRPIESDGENARAIALLERIGAESAPEYVALAELLTTLVEAYEAERYELPAATPLDVLNELLRANAVSFKDFSAIVGSKGNASEILSGKRRISRALARRLSERFAISHALFL